jgi:putative ABC transport system permease protein
VASIIFLALFAGIVAGGYPALLLSFLQPSDILKGSAKLTRTSRLRNALIVVQFAVSIALMGAAIIMTRQLEYMQTKHPGFNKEQVIIIQTGLRPSDGASIYETFRNVASQRSDVLGVAGSAATVGGDIAKVGFTGDNGTYHEFYATTTDERFLPVMGIQLLVGRNFQTNIASDQYEAIIVNEAFVKHFGWQNPLAEKLPGKNFPLHRIIGVMKDFHFQSLHSAIAPMMFVMKADSIGRGIENVDGGASLRSVNIISVRLAAGNMSATIAELEQLWKKIAPSKPFDYSFLNQELDKQYRHEERLGKLAGIAAVLAVSIACIGLFSLVALVMEQRTKEIGIRKVLGASVSSIITLLSKDFLRLVGIAIIIATPLAWWGMSVWLRDFAYRIELSWTVFFISGAMAILIASVTVAGQAMRAARSNPVQSLRSE